MNIFEKIGNFFTAIFNPKKLIDKGGDALEKALEKMATEKPKLFKVVVVGAHEAAKTYGPDLVKSTKTDVDDKVLAEFLQSCEAVATKHGLDLDFEAEQLLTED